VYNWLEKAGVKTVMQEMGVVNREVYSSGDKIEIAYADGDNYDRLKGLINEVAESLGTINYEDVEGKKRIVVRYPYSICNKNDLADRAKPGAQWLKVAAAISFLAGLDLNINSHNQNQRVVITPEVEDYSSFEQKHGCFKISFDVESFDEEDPESADHPNGITTIILAGDALQALTDPPSFLQDQVAVASEKARNLAARKEELRSKGHQLEGERSKKVAEAEAELERQQQEIARLEKELEQLEGQEREFAKKKAELKEQERKIEILNDKVNEAKNKAKEQAIKEAKEQATKEAKEQATKEAKEQATKEVKGKNSFDPSRRSFLKKAVGALAVVGTGAYLAKETASRGYLDFLFKEISELDKQFNAKLQELVKKGEINFEGDERIGSAREEIGVHEIDYSKEPILDKDGKRKNIEREIAPDSEPDGLEFYSPTGHTEGYYREFTGTAFVRNSRTDKGQWVNIESFEQYPFSVGEPKDFTLRLRRSLRGEARIPFRDGEKIIAIETVDKKPVEVKRERRTGNYVIRGFSKDVRIYYGLDREQKYRTMPPVEIEKVVPLDFKKLDKKWQTLIAVLRADKSLNLQQKAAVVITVWGRNFTYSDRKGLKINEQTMGDSVEEIGTKVVNRQLGDCDIASSGCAFLLRAVGVPARMPVGDLKNNQGGGGGHAWSEFWDGNKWISFEPQVGIKSDPVILAAQAKARREAVKEFAELMVQAGNEPIFQPTLLGTDDLLVDNAKIIDKFNRGGNKIDDEDILFGKAPDNSSSAKEIGIEVGKGLGYGVLGAFLARLFARKSEAKKAAKEHEPEQDS
jgi:hypothetical protein